MLEKAATTNSDDDQNVRQIKTMQERLNAVVTRSSNRSCLDCSSPNPTWALILTAPIVGGKPMGGLCCSICREFYIQLDRNMIRLKSVQVTDEWTEAEVKVVEETGNQAVNDAYEARLNDADVSSEDLAKVLLDKEKDMLGFILNKYQRRLFFSEKAYQQVWERLARHRTRTKALKSKSPRPSGSSRTPARSPSRNRSSQSPARTASVRSLKGSSETKPIGLRRVTSEEICRGRDAPTRAILEVKPTKIRRAATEGRSKIASTESPPRQAGPAESNSFTEQLEGFGSDSCVKSRGLSSGRTAKKADSFRRKRKDGSSSKLFVAKDDIDLPSHHSDQSNSTSKKESCRLPSSSSQGPSNQTRPKPRRAVSASPRRSDLASASNHGGDEVKRGNRLKVSRARSTSERDVSKSPLTPKGSRSKAKASCCNDASHNRSKSFESSLPGQRAQNQKIVGAQIHSRAPKDSQQEREATSAGTSSRSRQRPTVPRTRSNASKKNLSPSSNGSDLFDLNQRRNGGDLPKGERSISRKPRRPDRVKRIKSDSEASCRSAFSKESEKRDSGRVTVKGAGTPRGREDFVCRRPASSRNIMGEKVDTRTKIVAPRDENRNRQEQLRRRSSFGDAEASLANGELVFFLPHEHKLDRITARRQGNRRFGRPRSGRQQGYPYDDIDSRSRQVFGVEVSDDQLEVGPNSFERKIEGEDASEDDEDVSEGEGAYTDEEKKSKSWKKKLVKRGKKTLKRGKKKLEKGGKKILGTNKKQQGVEIAADPPLAVGAKGA